MGASCSIAFSRLRGSRAISGQVPLRGEPGQRFQGTALVALGAGSRPVQTFDIEPLGEKVKLTVVQDDFGPGSTVAEMVSEGWPQIRSDLKTLLETSQKLPRASESSMDHEALAAMRDR
jgi:hypothetical protein